MGRLTDEEIACYLEQLDINKDCIKLFRFECKQALVDLQETRMILHDLYERMVDVYDGAPDSTNHLPFTGGDIRDLEEVLR